MRAAVEAHLYPYGDLDTTPGRCTSAYQLSVLEVGRQAGMTDREVADFLSANLSCGGNTVYRRSETGQEPVGYVVLAGRYGPPDVMGRRAFYWVCCASRADARGRAETWEAGALYDAFRLAFGVPRRTEHVFDPQLPSWEGQQGTLF